MDDQPTGPRAERGSIITPRMAAVVVDADHDARHFASMLVEEVGLRVIECGSAAGAMEALDRSADETILMLIDESLPGETDGIRLARDAGEKWPWLTVLIKASKPRLLPEAPKSTHFLRKPWLPLQVLIETERAVAAARDFR